MAQVRKGKQSVGAQEYRDERGEVQYRTKSYVQQHREKSDSFGSPPSRGQGPTQQRSGGKTTSKGGSAEEGEEGRLGELFLETLKDIYAAEKQMFRAIGKIGRKTRSDELRQALQKHSDETEGQVERLEQVFDMLGRPPRGKACEAIEGLINEARGIMEKFNGTDALDAGLLSAAQAIEHYEIARYGTLTTWARQLGMRNAAKLLDETLQEEKKTDATLTKIAEERVNRRAH
jgi:ferritin-like metal-binding protein YciE